MGFGGGGAGGPIGAHVHDNNAGQGGALTTATLLGAASLDSQLIIDHIASHVAVSAESNHAFVLSIDFDVFSEVWVLFRGAQTAAFELRCQINNIGGTNNQSYGVRHDLPTTTTAVNPAASATQLSFTDTTGGGATFDLAGKARFWLTSDDLSVRQLYGQSHFALAGGHSWDLTNTIGGNIDSITEIDIQTSTSTWQIGTRIDVYGVKFA